MAANIDQLISKIDALITVIGKQTNTRETKSTQMGKTSSDITSLTSELLRAKSQGAQFEEKELEIKRKQISALEEELRLETQLDGYSEEKYKTAKESLEVAKQHLSVIEKESKALQDREKNTKLIAKTQDALLGGLKSRLGIEIDSAKVTKKISDSLKQGGSNMRALGDGMKEFGSQMTEPVNELNMLLKITGFLWDRFKLIDTATADLAKSLNIAYSEAKGVRYEMTLIAERSGEMAVTGASLAKSMTEMNTALGTSSKFTEERLIGYTKLRDVAKFEPEILEESNKISIASNKSQRELIKNRLTAINLVKFQTGLEINERKILSDIAKLSATTKLNYLGRDKDLAKAAAQAATLGMELGKVDGIANSLMDFEGSIQKQMEAEVLTGQTLNLERARYFALTNDLAGVQSELNAQGITAEKFAGMNRIQQEAIAGAMGMQKDEMSQMFIEQKVLANLGASSMEAARKKHEENVKTYGIEKAQAMLGDDSLARQWQQQSLQDRLNLALEKMLSLFDKIAIVFGPIVEAFTSLVDLLTKSEGLLKGIQVVLATIAATRFVNMGRSLLGGAGNLSTTVTQAGRSMMGGATGPSIPPPISTGPLSPPSPPAGPVTNPGVPNMGIPSPAGAGNTPTTVSQPGGSMMGGGTGNTMAPTPGPAGPLTPPNPTTGPLTKSGKPDMRYSANRQAATENTPTISVGGGSILSNMAQGMGLGAGIKSAFANGAWVKVLKGSALNTIMTALFGYMDYKSLMDNPVDENGKPLNKKELAKRASKIAMGSLGGVIGGILGTAVGGPVGSMVGSLGGQWLMGKISDWAPDFSARFGEMIVPQEKLDAAPALANGGLVTQTGMAKVDSGEVYLGANSLQILKDLVTETRQQNQYLQALVKKDTNISMDGQAVAGVVARNVITSYGNLLNPSSATYA